MILQSCSPSSDKCGRFFTSAITYHESNDEKGIRENHKLRTSNKLNNV